MGTFYVNPTGSDSNDGSAHDSAFLTIKHAVEVHTAAGSGDWGTGHTILVYPAASANHTYAENSVINCQQSAIPSKLQQGMTIRAITGSYDVTIDFTNNSDGYGIKGYTYTKIEGFTFTGSTGGAGNPNANAYVVSTANGAVGPIHVLNCTFDNCSGTQANATCVQLGHGSVYGGYVESILERCIFKNCHRPAVAHGLTAPHIRACLAHDCTSSYSTFDAGLGLIENCTAVRCRIKDSTTNYIFSVSVAGYSVAQIRNCVAAHCYTKGYLYNSSADPPISASLAYDNIFDTSRLFKTATQHCSTAAPKFVKLSNTRATPSFASNPWPVWEDGSTGFFTGDDFHLKCGSPASGSGTGHIAAGAFGHGSNTVIASQSHDLDGIAYDSRTSLGPYRNMGCYDTGGPDQRMRYVDKTLTWVPGTTLTLRCVAGFSHKIIGVDGSSIDKFIGVEGDSIGAAIGVE
jgi:hypothetical protein